MTSPSALVASIRYRGFAGTFGRLVRRSGYLSSAEEFDQRYGVDTAGRVEAADSGGSGENLPYAVHYEGTHAPSFLSVIASLKLHHEDYTFLDYGSGKGLAMLLASWFPFRRIRGVEFSPDLHAVCEANIRSFHSHRQRCFDIESVCADATEVEIPSGLCVFYFFNPFGGPVMRRVLANIAASCRAEPREMYLVYFNPRAADMVTEAGFVQLAELHGHRVYRML